MQSIKNPKYYVDTIQYLLSLQAKTGKPNISFSGALFSNSKDAASLFMLNPSKIFMIPFNSSTWVQNISEDDASYSSWSIEGYINFTNEDGTGGIPVEYFTPLANYMRKDIKINEDGELVDSGDIEYELSKIPNSNYVSFLGHNFRTTQSYPTITFETERFFSGDTIDGGGSQYEYTVSKPEKGNPQQINYPTEQPFDFDNFSMMHWEGLSLSGDEIVKRIKLKIETGFFNSSSPDWHSKLGTKIYIGSISIGTVFIMPQQLAPNSPLYKKNEDGDVLEYIEPPYHDADADVKLSIINRNKTKNTRTGGFTSNYMEPSYTYTGLSASCFDLLANSPANFTAEDIFHKNYPLKKHTSFVPDGTYNFKGQDIIYDNKWLGNQDKGKFRKFGRRMWEISYSNIPFNFLYPLSDSSQTKTDESSGVNRRVYNKDETNAFSHYNFYSMVFSRTLGSELPFIFATQSDVHRDSDDYNVYSNYASDQFGICKFDFSEYGVTREKFVEFAQHSQGDNTTGLGKLDLSIKEI